MSPRAGSATYRLVMTGLLLWAMAATTYATLRLTFGYRPAVIHVRWSPSVDEAARQRMEQRHSLVLPKLQDGRTYSYALINTDDENVRGLVLDPAVEDTHYLHRTAFRVGYFAPRLPYLTPRPAIPAALELIVGADFSGRTRECRPRASRNRRTRAHSRARPHREECVSRPSNGVARHEGSCRILDRWTNSRRLCGGGRAVPNRVRGTALECSCSGGQCLQRWPLKQRMLVSSTHQLLLRIFIDAPWVADWLPAWLVFWGSLFIVGAFARTAFACLTIGMLGWATLYTIATSYHTVCALLLSLLALQWSRWGDAWSVDAWRQRAHPAPRGTPQEYGYTTWAPALVLGIVYFAAAFAKMRDTGLAWILNGTVKYHFLSDSPQAMVDWGLQLGHYPGLAIALSFCAIAVETLIIVGVSARAYRYRVAAGLGALSLMTGFVLLQGIYWPAWWILLLSFLPWHLVRPADSRSLRAARAGRDADPARQPKFAIVLVIALLGQQSIVSLMRIEASPVLSTYDMYSTTYGSPADYEHNAGQVYWIVGVDQTAKDT